MHGLYEQFGFTALSKPQDYKELRNPDVYKEPNVRPDPE
jgi:hypothetical protein